MLWCKMGSPGQRGLRPGTCTQYEDELLQSLALSVLPLDALEAEAAETAAASASLGERPPLAPADALALLLLEWFKRFFTWVCASYRAAVTVFLMRLGRVRGTPSWSRTPLAKGARSAPGAYILCLVHTGS